MDLEPGGARQVAAQNIGTLQVDTGMLARQHLAASTRLDGLLAVGADDVHGIHGVVVGSA